MKKNPRRAALQDLRNNPFSDRNNHPCLDVAFESPDRSSSIIQNSVLLNMSIGARASIAQNTRQVTKYGLDGDGNGVYQMTSSTSMPPPSPNKSITSNTRACSPENNASDEWDRLLDRTQDNTSIIESLTMSQTQSYASFLLMRDATGHNMNFSSPHTFDDDNQNLDMTCDRSDYFNSSKVMRLGTPERNRAKVDEASRLARLGIGSLQKRGNVQGSVNESTSISGGSTSGELEQSGMIGFFEAAIRLGSYGDGNDDNCYEGEHTETESFISYHEPNISIMNTNNSCIRKGALEAYNEEDQIDISLEHGNLLASDVQASFISYRDPDLSMISDRGMNRTPSEFARSEFDVDVSEIIAPSDFLASPYRRKSPELISPKVSESQTCVKHYSEDRPFATSHQSKYVCEDASPTDFDDNLKINDGTCCPATSPTKIESHYEVSSYDSHGNMSMKHRSRDHIDGNGFIGVSNSLSSGISIHGMISQTNEILSSERNIRSLFHNSHGPMKNEQDPFMIEKNASFISPIDKQCYQSKERHNSGSHQNVDFQLMHKENGHLAIKFQSTSDATKAGDKHEDDVPEFASQLMDKSARDCETNVSSFIIPQRMSLRERYSQASRFLEESHSVPFSTRRADRLQVAPSDDQSISVNRSLLDAFESSS